MSQSSAHTAGGYRLRNARSPYLRQHADNPVDWHPWGDEAFARARSDNKLVFLSIGYATCHWCHVMAHESFENREIATLLARDYVAIKVDREERPDIDAAYMEIAQRMRGGGGWPLTVFMTADGLPLLCATYIPRDSGHGGMGLRELLPLIAERWRENPHELEEQVRKLVDTIAAETASGDVNGSTIGRDILARADNALRDSYDPHRGGFGPPPRFPCPPLLAYLLQRGARQGDEHLLAMAEHTLDAMRAGGLFDQLGFGFHRYSTDADWLLPHFEKMLYDQAGLARVYLEAFALTGEQRYADTARETLTYLLRDLLHADGGFCSGEDADAEGVEGKFYVWEQKEIEGLLGVEAELFCSTYGVKPQGNYTEEVAGHGAGGNILHLPRPLAEVAAGTALSVEALDQRLAISRALLLEARDQRVRPQRDDKRITAWNGLAIAAFALGGTLLQEPAWIEVASETAELFLNEARRSDGRLLRFPDDGGEPVLGFSDDYAALAAGLLDLHQATQETPWLEAAIDLANDLYERFADPVQGGLFDSGDDGERLVLRSKSRFDGAQAAASSIALRLFVQLQRLTGEVHWQNKAESMLQGIEAHLRHYPQGFAALLAGFDLLTGETEELLVSDGEGTAGLQEAARRTWNPWRTVLVKNIDNADTLAELAAHTAEITLDGKARAWLCRGGSCLPPTGDPVTLRRQLLKK